MKILPGDIATFRVPVPHENIRRICAAAVIIMSAALSGCAFLPTEDVPLAAPLLNSYEQRQPTLVAVRRDDLVQTKTISCRSRPIREETYSFPVGGIYIDHIYVSAGDSVSAGDILGELERKEILTQVEEAKISVRKQEYALELAKDDTELRRIEYSVNSGESNSESYEKAKEDYTFGVAYEEKRLEIAERKLATLLDMAEERVIYTKLDGVVSYAKRYANQDRSIAGDKAFTVSDASELIYTVMGDDASFFTPGEIYSMKVSKAYLEMRAVSPEEIGEDTPNNPVIYFIPEDLTAGLATYGYIQVETNRRDGVLFLPASAIIQVGDDRAVYRIGESGYRELSPVEIGVTISGKTEITSGLSEGDEVILD